MNGDQNKRIEQAEYRTKLVEAELHAIHGSKAYKLSKKAGIIKSQITSDPVGLTKKAAKVLLKNPRKARHLFRSLGRGADAVQTSAEQTAKYQEWILLNEPDEDELELQRKAADKLKLQPLISIVTPVFNPPLDVFEELIESVLEQTYTNFELCLGDFGDDGEIDALIAKYAKLDSRIKHYKFSENLGIAGNSNQILEKIKGEFVALLDHDDTISPDALYENALLLNEKPYDFIYSDKDKIDDKGNRFDPLFKPEISPEMLLNVNYLTHLNIMRSSIVKDIGGWDPVTDGAQDWDLFIRVLEKSKHIGFIPKVLYHWRVIATSTAMSIETKPYALANQCKAIDKHLANMKVDGKAYVDRTELFIEWGVSSLDLSPVVFIYYSNLTNTKRLMRRFRKACEKPVFVLLTSDLDEDDVRKLRGQVDCPVLAYSQNSLVNVVRKYFNDHKDLKSRVAVFTLDSIKFAQEDNWYERLTGWLAVPGVGASSGRLINKYDLIVNSGGIIMPSGEYQPLFKQFPRYYQSYVGNSEWVRNLSMLSPMFFATRIDLLQEFANLAQPHSTLEGYFTWATKTYRLVMSPHATAMITTSLGVDSAHLIADVKKPFLDPYGSPNTSSTDPIRLFEDEALVGQGGTQVAEIDTYQHDATILADTFDISEKEIASCVSGAISVKSVRSVAWLLPSFDSVYAGLMNIFSFANYLSEQKKLETTFYILTADNTTEVQKHAIQAAFPSWTSFKVVPMRPDDISKIAVHDIGIATQWATAYPLAKVKTISKKYYFIQDNEVSFYPKGSVSALVELSYRFGFTAIAGTEGLLEMYEKQYGGSGTVLKSKVDLSAYHPRKNLYYTPAKPYKVFFYARPNMPRNAFELGIAGLKKLKLELGEGVEIITAGAVWDAASYGVEGLFNNLGKIDYLAVPKLYRSVDVGLMFMFSGHPGVTASELMASGCPVVVNEYDDITWNELYEHEKTCLITIATASEVARNLRRCLEDDKLRKALIDGGLAKTKTFYDGYALNLDRVFDEIEETKHA